MTSSGSASSSDTQSVGEKSESSKNQQKKSDKNCNHEKRLFGTPLIINVFPDFRRTPDGNSLVRSSITVKGSIWTHHVEDTTELEVLRRELIKAKQTIFEMQEKEQKMKERLAEQAQKMLDRGIPFENVCIGEKRPTALIRKYGNLYAQARVDTLDALDGLPQLRDADELKSKLLFSVVVVSSINLINYSKFKLNSYFSVIISVSSTYFNTNQA